MTLDYDYEIDVSGNNSKLTSTNNSDDNASAMTINSDKKATKVDFDASEIDGKIRRQPMSSMRSLQ